MRAQTSASGVNEVSRRKVVIAGVGLGLVSCTRNDTSVRTTSSESRQVFGATDATVPVKLVDAPDIVVGAGLIPGMVNSSSDGVMVDLIKAMSAAYTGGSIAVRAMTVGRLDVELVEGLVDMTMPYIRMRPNDDVNFKYRFTRKGYGKVSFVLYSRKANPVTAAAISKAALLHPFPYKIESAEFDWGFPVAQFLSFESAFKKLAAGRIDAFLWAQEEADEELRRQGSKGIVRELFGIYDDVFAVQRNARGDYVEKVYEQTLEAMQKSGKLEASYNKIHKPYDPWQP